MLEKEYVYQERSCDAREKKIYLRKPTRFVRDVRLARRRKRFVVSRTMRFEVCSVRCLKIHIHNPYTIGLS